MPSRVQGIAGQLATSATLTLTLPSAPTVGNLLVFTGYTPAPVAQASAAVPGFTQDVITNTASNASAVILSRKVQSGDGATHTLTWADATLASTAMGELIEIAPGAGNQWASTGLIAATGSSAGTSNTTGTVTATGASGGASYAIACIGLGGTAAFLHTWTGGFTWDGQAVASGRFSVAAKDSASSETFSTTETWDTARIARIALAAYKVEAAPTAQAPTGLVATPVAPDRIDTTWNPVSGKTYYLERDGTVIASGLTSPSYSDTGLTGGSSHTYRAGVPA